MSSRYFQLGGYRGQITSPRSMYDDKDLADAIAGPSSPLRSMEDPEGGIELVLGIKRSGSSHLLLTTGQLEELYNANREGGTYLVTARGQPLSARDFESLSPIMFLSVDQLARKLATLKPKSGKDNRQDTSQANRIFNSGNLDNYRGAFERGRVLFRILNGAIDAEKYSVNDTSWSQILRVSSFIFNVKGIDDRKQGERLRNPIVLDVGFCNANVPSLEPDLSKAYHIINEGNQFLGGKSSKTPFKYGSGSEKVPNSSMQTRMNEFFQDNKHRGPTPMILLVYNQELTLNYLHKMKIDTSSWTYDLSELLTADTPNSRDSGSDRRHPDNRSRSGYSRSRSRSPSRRPDPRAPYRNAPPTFQSLNRGNNYSDAHAPSSSASQNPANSRTRLYSPVYMLDVEKLYMKLMSNDQFRSINDIARHLGMTEANGMCAGNEAVLMIKIWKEMISGPPIDEQRELRLKASNGNPAPSSSSTTNAGPSDAPRSPENSDDEQDPNDVVAPPVSKVVNPAKGRAKFGSDDESDYGEDDDSGSDD